MNVLTLMRLKAGRTVSHTTREAILTYLEVVEEPAPVIAIVRYMERMHRVDAGAVRTCLYRLHKQGRIRHPQAGWYQRIDTGSAGGDVLEQITPD